MQVMGPDPSRFQPICEAVASMDDQQRCAMRQVVVTKCAEVMRDKTIPWSEIVDVTTWRGKSIILHIRGSSLFPGRGMSAILTRINRMIAGGHVDIMLTGFNRGFDEAMDAIADFRR